MEEVGPIEKLHRRFQPYVLLILGVTLAALIYRVSRIEADVKALKAASQEMTVAK